MDQREASGSSAGDLAAAALTRRDLLRAGAAGGLGLGLAGLVATDSAAARGARALASASAAGPKRGGVLTFARAEDPVTLNPIGPSDNGSIWAMMQIFDQLVEVQPGSPNPQPGLAESWDVTNGGRTWTFHLRDAEFSNGAPVTAQDVKFSIERFANPKINTGYSFLSSAIDSVKVLDSHTVQVDLSHVLGSFIYNISIFVASIVPQATFEKLGAKGFGNAPIGSGPFQLKQWKRGQFMQLVRNPNYWRSGQPYLDEVMFEYIANDEARVLKIQSGAVDVAESIPFASVAEVNSQSGVRVVSFPSTAIDAVYLNNRQHPLNELPVRMALNLATPKAAMVSKILFGAAEVANDCIPKLKYWDSSVPAIPYDIAMAKAALAKSSVAKGFPLELLVAGDDTVSEQKAEILQAQWGEIGVKVSITTLDLGTLSTKWTTGNYQALSFPEYYITSDVTVDDEEAEAQFNFKAGFDSLFTWYDNPTAISLVAQATGTLDEAARHATFAKLQRFGLQQVPIVPLFFVPYLTGVRDNVQNFHTLPAGWWNLGDVWLT